jgi:predicted HicB family RNase H-like nuclease
MKDILKYKGFIGSVHFSTDDRIFFGKIEGINDLVTFEGTTVDELENGFQSVVEQHINDCEKEGNPVEKSYKGSFNVGISPDLHRQAAQIASVEGITLNQSAQRAIQHEIELE